MFKILPQIQFKIKSPKFKKTIPIIRSFKFYNTQITLQVKQHTNIERPKKVNT